MPRFRRPTDEVRAFCGWDYLLDLIKVCRDVRERGFLATLFETGGRVQEVLMLKRGNLDFGAHPDFIVVHLMPVVKRYEKVGEYRDGTGKARWKTERLRDFRTFPIKKSEPLVRYMVEYYEKVDRDLLFPFGRATAFLMIRNIGSRLGDRPVPGTLVAREERPLYSREIYPHLFRAERASQLAEDYGFNEFTLRSFFQWRRRKPEMAELYASMGWKGLARAMGGEV
jgi:site-specific recombinase XerD